MELEERIKKLDGLLRKYTVSDIEKLYKEEEVEHLKNHLSKYPEVKYSEKMLKKMYREARGKKLSKGRKAYLEFLINKNLNYDEEKLLSIIKSQAFEFIELVSSKVENLNEIKLIHIEHDSLPNAQHVQVYGHDDRGEMINELASFEMKIDFSELWGFENEKKALDLTEELEMITIEEEEYATLFPEIFKLRSYKLLKRALKSKEVSQNLFTKIGKHSYKIQFGEHDNWVYKIFESK